MTSSDELGRLRTKLANERTLLAYVRTGLAVCAAGVSVIAFFDSPPAQIVGWSLSIVGVLVLVLGLARFRGVDRQL
jgi:putative membrane protein